MSIFAITLLGRICCEPNYLRLNPSQNAHVLACTLRFFEGFSLDTRALTGVLGIGSIFHIHCSP